MAITTQISTAECAARPGRPLPARLLLGLLLLWLLLLSGCAALPPLDGRNSSAAVADTAGTPIGQALAPLLAQHPGLTGIAALDDGRLAFGTRVRLAQAATRSIDVQTYIWNDDATGSVLFEEMLRAAERGVRVRLLLDDANTGGRDPLLALLAAQPNLELRLYNPFVYRGSKALGFLGDFSRLNHRMHNKSFTVDNQVAVVGGRNLADEYFEAAQETNFADLDVVTVGAAVREVSAEFDLYWNSASAYPAPLLLADVPAMPRQTLAARVDAVKADAASAAYAQAIQNTEQVQQLLTGRLALEWTRAQVLADDPAKTLGTDTDGAVLMLPSLATSLGAATRSLDLVSPYFVPGAAGTAQLAALAQRGVRVRVLTNSLAATDSAAVHAAYARRRVDLLRAGVQLLEIKPNADAIQRRAKEIGSSSRAGLHAKTYAVDQRSIFVGSFNFDPRSARLNTEMGLVIHSPALASSLAGIIDGAGAGAAFRVVLGEDGRLRWLDGASAVLADEPETGWLRRVQLQLLSWLPIEWML